MWSDFVMSQSLGGTMHNSEDVNFLRLLDELIITCFVLLGAKTASSFIVCGQFVLDAGYSATHCATRLCTYTKGRNYIVSQG